jgi:hypothetical protein
MILAAWIIGPGTVVVISNMSSRIHLIVGVIVLSVGTLTAGWLLVRGRRLVAQHASEVLAADMRPPILLLRSFNDDQMELERPNRVMFSSPVVTFEEAITDVCSWYGPVIAIGRPGESLPPIGAARLWVDHGSWQQRVTALLHDCELVVMIMGAVKGRDGLAWEVETILKLGFASKLVLVVPPLKNEEMVKGRWRSYQWLTQGKLPNHQGGEISATCDKSGHWLVDRKGAGESRNQKTYKRMLNTTVRRLAGEPRRAWAIGFAKGVQKAATWVIVGALFIAASIYKSELDRKQREDEDRWRNPQRYNSPTFESYTPPRPVLPLGTPRSRDGDENGFRSPYLRPAESDDPFDRFRGSSSS